VDYYNLFLLGYPLLLFTVAVIYQYLVNGKVFVFGLASLHWLVMMAILASLEPSERSLQLSAIWLVVTLLFVMIISSTLWFDYKNGTTIGAVDDYKRISFKTTVIMICCGFAVFVFLTVSLGLFGPIPPIMR